MGKKVPCGQCMNCRINKQRKWLLRLILEKQSHDWTSFVTLTYNPDSVPITQCPDTGALHQSLKKKDVQDWLMRIRYHGSLQYLPTPRYYGCGEYGPSTHRPHYHLIMFGIPFTSETLIRDTWGLGHITVSEATETRLAYCAKYTLKKRLTQPEELFGRQKEFSLMSRRPPIGSLSVPNIADSLRTKKGNLCLVQGHVQKILKVGKSTFPLDRTMFKKLREEMDIPEHIAKVVFIDNYRGDPTEDEQAAATASNKKATRRARKATQNAV